MKNLVLLALACMHLSIAAGQHLQFGAQAGIHNTLVQIHYYEASYWAPMDYHVNFMTGLPLKDKILLQMELGLAGRRSWYTDSGVSHSLTREFRLLQLESSVLAKYQFNTDMLGVYILAGFTSGLALAGSEHRKGSSVGPASWDVTERLDFDYFPYRRWSLGPVIGINMQVHLKAGDLVLYARLLRSWEPYCPGCGNVAESRIMAGLGYYRNL